MGKDMSTTTSRVMKGAAVSLRLSLSTLSAQGRDKAGQQLSSYPRKCRPNPHFIEEGEEVQKGSRTCPQGGQRQVHEVLLLWSLRDLRLEDLDLISREQCGKVGTREISEKAGERAGPSILVVSACPAYHQSLSGNSTLIFLWGPPISRSQGLDC